MEQHVDEPRISICIVTGGRLPLLAACLDSLAAQEAPPPFEVLVCAHGAPEVAGAVHRRFPSASVCDVEDALPGGGRNLLLERARGELLLFLDDDVTVAPDLLTRLDALARAHPEAGVFGGPNDTPPGSSRFQFVQGAVLASLVGSGPVRRRYGAHPAGEADERFFILCNLAVRRQVMRPFAHDLVCAEENELLSAMSRSGVRMFYDPALVVYHERRPTLGGFASQMCKYGRGRGQLSRRDPATVRPAYLAPLALLAYLLFALPAVLVAGWAAAAPGALYAAAVGADAAWIARTLRRVTALPLAAFLLVVLHACYGAGLVRGLLERQATVDHPEAAGWRVGAAGPGVPPRVAGET